MERFPEIHRTVIRAAVAAGALLIAGCTTANPEAAPARLSAPASVTTTKPFDHCNARLQDTALLSFSDNHFATEDEDVYVYQVVNFMESAMPNATAEEFTAQVITATKPNDGQPNVNITVDTSKGFEYWLSPSDEETKKRVKNSKENIVATLTDLANIMNDYPAGLFDALDVKTIDVSDKHADDEMIAGEYDSSKSMIHIEAELHEEIEIYNPLLLRRYVAHEVGHAMHDRWCNGFDMDDVELAGDIKFYGHARLKDSKGQKMPIAPKEQYSYGAERVYVSDYGASTVQEYFATIIEFTIEDRGLILAGDADYGSVLQRNQELVVGRAEKMFPGFRDFAQERTKVLRLSSHNEIYDDIETIEVRPSDLAAVTSSPIDERTSINGVLLMGGIFSSEPTATALPWIQREHMNSDNFSVKVLLTENSNSDLGFKVFADDRAGSRDMELVIYRLPQEPGLFVSEKVLLPYVEQYEVTTGFQETTNSVDVVAMIDDLKARGAKPQRIKFIKD